MTGKRRLSTYFGVLPGMPEAAMLRLLLETGIGVVGAEEGSFLAYDPGKQALRFVMTAGNKASEQTLLGQTVPLGKGLVGLAAVSREAHIGAPVYHDIKQRRRRRAASGEPEAVIAAPIVAGETLLGVMTAISFDKKKRFTQNDAALVTRFGLIAGLLIDQRRRLTAAETDDPHHLAGAKSLGAAGKWEARILASIGNILRARPEAMADLTRTIEGVEALILHRSKDGDGVA